MKQKPHIPRAALAASVAVIALSSTPLTAQTAPQPVAPPVVAPSPAPAAPPVIPEPNLAPAPTGATQPAAAPSIRLPEVDTTARREPATETQTASASRDAPARTSRASEPRPTAVASAAEESAEPALPVQAEAEPTLSKADAAKQELATKIDGATLAPSGETGGGAGEEGWLAALAGLLGLGAIGGGAYAVARRRKRKPADEPVEAMPEERVEPARPAPAFAAANVERSAPRRRPAMARSSAPGRETRVTPARGRLIDHIDFSQQPGFYEAQVDQGPTPINPFLTFRKRITRARFLDRQLRLAAERRAGSSRTFRPSARPPVRERVLEPA